MFCSAARLDQPLPDAAPADLQSLPRQQLHDPARAVDATTLRSTTLHAVPHLLMAFRLSAEWAAERLVVATARDLREPIPATHLALRVLLAPPSSLHGRCGAKYAVALVEDIPLLLKAYVFFA